MKRKIDRKIKGYRTKDGAGVSLVRVLGHETARDFDPILMLDSFDSTNKDDYMAGFPMHPHRGMETITFLMEGRIKHRDSLGNEDIMKDGEVQWMTAGSGILHEEIMLEAKRLLGVQVWLNMPKDKKMSKPEYQRLDSLPRVDINGGYLRIVSGEYRGTKGFEPKYSPLDFYHLHLNAGEKFEFDNLEGRLVTAFILLGAANIADESIEEKTAVRLTDGDSFSIETDETSADVLVLVSKPLNEEIAWGGPVVMSTQEDLKQAFTDLRMGTFIKSNIEY